MEQNTFLLTATVTVVVAIIAYKLFSKKPFPVNHQPLDSNSRSSNNKANLPYGNKVVENKTPKDENKIDKNANIVEKKEEVKEEEEEEEVQPENNKPQSEEEEEENLKDSNPQISPQDVQPTKLKISCGVYETKGRRPTMEDKHFTLVSSEIEGKEVSMFAIYDGHRGIKASEFLEENLHEKIFKSEAFKKGEVEVALKEGFAVTDEELLTFARSSEPKVMDGSTAAVAMIIDHTLYAANCGDAEVILARKNEDGSIQDLALSKLHKPLDPEEKKRITSEGGMVLQGRVGGTLAVSRAFGDLDFKTPYQDDDIKLGILVTADPYTTVTELIPNQDLFIIIGCDGVWERLTRSNTINFVASKINEEADLNVIAEELVNHAFSSGSQDNISVIVVKLNWS